MATAEPVSELPALSESPKLVEEPIPTVKRTTKSKVTPSAEKLQKYVDATLPVKGAIQAEKATPPEPAHKIDTYTDQVHDRLKFSIRLRFLATSRGKLDSARH